MNDLPLLLSAGLAALLHLFFFFMESLWWQRPAVRRIFRNSEEQALVTKFLAFNQGFYNLFLALGTAAGLWLLRGGHPEGGRALVTLACGSMLGAALVLASGGRGYLRGVVLQGLPPLLALIFLWRAPA